MQASAKVGNTGAHVHAELSRGLKLARQRQNSQTFLAPDIQELTFNMLAQIIDLLHEAMDGKNLTNLTRKLRSQRLWQSQQIKDS